MSSPADQVPRPTLRSAVILVVAYAGLSLAAHLGGPTLASPLLPLLHWGLEWTHPDFAVDSMTVHGDRVQVQARLQVATPGRASHRTATAHFEMDPKQFFAVPIIVFALVLAWPHRSRKIALVALGLAVPLVACVELMDVPYGVAAAISDQVARQSNTTSATGSFWWFFLDNGGRQFLAVLAAAGAALGAGKVTGRIRPAADSVVVKQRQPKARKKVRVPDAPGKRALDVNP